MNWRDYNLTIRFLLFYVYLVSFMLQSPFKIVIIVIEFMSRGPPRVWKHTRFRNQVISNLISWFQLFPTWFRDKHIQKHASQSIILYTGYSKIILTDLTWDVVFNGKRSMEGEKIEQHSLRNQKVKKKWDQLPWK